MNISQKAIDKIIFFEVGDEDYYKKYLIHPTWPGEFSGVTISFGYDLGYNTLTQFTDDWEKYLSDEDYTILAKTIGVVGKSAYKLISSLQTITIPWEIAKTVFIESTLPRFYDLTLKIYPGVNKLCPDACGALVSLVYNRGGSLNGSRRAEMKAIVECVANKDYQCIADNLRSMKRLWENKGVDGLLVRREEEAKLVESCIV